MRAALVIAVFLSLCAVALAQDVGFQPMVPQLFGPVGHVGGAMVPGNGPMVPNEVNTSTPPPPSCSGALDLSQGCIIPGLG